MVEEGMDGGQAGIAGLGAVTSFDFKMFEKRRDQVGIDIGEVHFHRRPTATRTGEFKPQSEGVLVAEDGVQAGAALPGEALFEEPSQQRRQ